MATEFTTAVESFEFAATRFGTPRGEAGGANQLKERSGVTLGDGVAITDSRFLTADNGGPIDPANLTVQRGVGLTNGEGAAGSAVSVSSTAPGDGDASEIALIRTGDTDAGPLMGMVFYADPNEASGAMVATGYSRFDDGATPKSVAVTLDPGSVASVTLKNRIGPNDVWVTSTVEDGIEGGWQGAGVFQSLDIDGDGISTHYLAGVLVGPLRAASGDVVYAIDPTSDVYRDLAAQLQSGGVAADDIGRNALVASSAGGRLDGTYLNEDFQGSAVADDLRGADGDDLLFGAGGDDSLRGGRDEDTVIGGAGDDVLRGQGQHDLLQGGAGNDNLMGNNGNDVLIDDDGNDRLSGGNGNDELTGSGGDNRLNGGRGNDTMTAGEGADRLNGGSGNDIMVAGDGNDWLDGGTGQDILTGGAGADRFIFSSDGNDEVLDFDLAEDRLQVRATGANSLADLTLTDLAAGRVQVEGGALSVILNDGDGIADFTAADFQANDFIF
ncbi:MAG: calcium-binding protein [Pseudomonadota bacterium]